MTVKAPLLSLAFVLALSASLLHAQARSVERASPGNISVHADGMPLEALLLALSEVIDFDMLLVDRAVEERPVTVSLDDEPIEDALWEILEAAKVSGIVWGEEGKAFRLFAGSPSDDTSTRRQVRSLLEEPSDSGATGTVGTGTAAGREATAPAPASPPREAPRRAMPAPRAPRTASGDASLERTPGASELARLAAVLGSGLLVGGLVVGRGRGSQRER